MTTMNDSDKGWLEANLEDPEFRRLYAREDLIEEFLHQIEHAMKEKGVSRAQLADKLGCSSANVTRIMRRTTNLTARTMADLAFVLGLRFRVQLEPLAAWLGRYLNHVAGATVPTMTSALERERLSWSWPAQRVIFKRRPVSSSHRPRAA